MRNLDGVVTNLLQQSRAQGRTDEELLFSFSTHQDETAFAELVRRYTHLVSGVCQNVLRDEHRAEDAYQAAFLVLARKAPWLLGRPLVLGGWLYRVARRTAMRAKIEATREQARAARADALRAANPDAHAVVSWHEVKQVLDEELDRLPEKYRVPFVLCFIEGLTQDEAARRLALPRGTFRLRLDAARAVLQKRLIGRGVSLSALAILAIKSQPVSAAVALETVRAAVAFAAGRAAPAGARPGALVLAGWMLKSAVPLSALVALGAAAVVTVLAGVAAAYSMRREPDPPVASRPVDLPPVKANDPVAVPPIKVNDAPKLPVLPLAGRVIGPDGQAVAGATVVVLADRVYQRGRYERHDQRLFLGETGEGGQFRLAVPANFPTWSPEARPVKVLVQAPGASLAALSVPDFWDGLPRQEVRLTERGEVRGRVLSADGRPVAGAAVRTVRVGVVHRDEYDAAGDALPCWPAAVATDDRGEFAIPALDAAAGVTLSVRAPGFCVNFVTAPRGAKSWDVRLHPAQPFRGRVVAADTGLPVAGCEVTLTSRSPQAPFLTARSDADGRFEVAAGPDRQFAYKLYLPEGQPYPAVAGAVTAGAGDKDEVTLRVPRGVLVEGVVKDAVTAAPIPGARIALAAPVEAARAPVPIQGGDSIVVSGPDGRFRMPVPYGRANLVVYAPNNEYVSEPFDWREGGKSDPVRQICVHGSVPLDFAPGAKVREVEVSLRRGATARCEVVNPDGTPVANAMLVCRSLTSLVLPVRQGEFLLPGLRPGCDYPVVILDPESQAGTTTVIRADGDRRPVIRLQPCVSAQVRFVNAAGQPVRGHQPRIAMCLPVGGQPDKLPVAAAEDPVASMLPVAVFNPRQQAAMPRTGPDGRAVIPALIPGVRYELYHTTETGTVVHGTRFSTKAGEERELPDETVRRP